MTKDQLKAFAIAETERANTAEAKTSTSSNGNRKQLVLEDGQLIGRKSTSTHKKAPKITFTCQLSGVLYDGALWKTKNGYSGNIKPKADYNPNSN